MHIRDVALARDLYAKESPLKLAQTLKEVAGDLVAVMKPEKAVELFEESLAIEKEHGQSKWITASTQSQLGSVLSTLRKFDDAKLHLVGGYEALIIESNRIPKSERKKVLSQAIKRLIEFGDQTADQEYAKKWKRELIQLNKEMK
jgi:hypothetical protein